MPELAWQVSLLPHTMTLSTLPPNLFSLPRESHPSACLDELKRDLQRLQQLRQYEAEFNFLTRRIDQKISVLVRLCQIQQQKHKHDPVNARLMMRMCKRRQWVEEIEQQVQTLKLQQQQLHKQLEKVTNADILLKIKSHAGDIQKQITTLEEKLTKITL